MVYDGRPSTGCQTCRKRRVKCDEGRPTCGQCIRSRRDCLGYRDTASLFFRDQTQTTVLRVKRSENRKLSADRHESASSAGSSIGDEEGDDAQALVLSSRSNPGTIPHSLLYPIEAVAVMGYMEHFVQATRHPAFSPGHLRHFPSVYAKSAASSPLSAATSALSYAAAGNFNNTGPRNQFHDLAWGSYSKAMSRLNQALLDPLQAKKNETLLTVLLFVIIESLLADSGGQWNAKPHISGAVSLLKMRGKDLIEDETSSTLFMTMRALSVLDSHQSREPLNDFFRSEDFGWQARLIQKQQNFNTRLAESATLMPALRSRAIKAMQLPHSADSHRVVQELLKQCQELDLTLARWPATIPQDWQYITIAKAPEVVTTNYATVELYPGNIDIYYDGWISNLWSSHRCMRLFLNAIIMRCISYLTPTGMDANMDSTYIDASQKVQTLVDDICSSTPYHIGYLPSTAEMACQYANVPTIAAVQPSAIGGYFFLWPLFVSLSALTVPQKQRDWIRGRIQQIAYRFGSTKAIRLLEIHKNDPKRPLYAEDWDSSFFENLFEAASLYASGGL